MYLEKRIRFYCY